jgi:hypothetical protein
MSQFSRLSLLVFISLFLLSGCNKEEEVIQTKPEAPALTVKVNQFIKDVMTDAYLWYDEMPAINIRYEFDSKAYFKKLLYNEDKWSIVTDNRSELEGSLSGVETTFGYSLAFGSFTDNSGNPTGNYFAIVEYVYPNTPASNAGFIRGDIIIKINGENITSSNYATLFSGTNVSVTKGILTETGISEGTSVNMTAELLNLNPVLIYKVIEIEGHKIGYLVYLQYISEYNATSLQTALQYLKDNQVSELIIDLRYNPGGTITSAQFLSSSIVPLNVVDNSSILVTFQWNDKYQDYWIANNVRDQIEVKFNASVPVKLGMNKVYFLTGSGTASASELTITGVNPYMDVTLVGDTTYGKYTGMFLLAPKDVYDNSSYYSGFRDWGIMPVIFRYANSQGITDFKNGFPPDFYVVDELMPAEPLGELTEPLLKKAVENIVGHALPSPKKAELPFRYEIFFRGSSKWDAQKGNLFINKQELIPK